MERLRQLIISLRLFAGGCWGHWDIENRNLSSPFVWTQSGIPWLIKSARSFESVFLGNSSLTVQSQVGHEVGSCLE